MSEHSLSTVFNNAATNADAYSKPVDCRDMLNVRLQVFGDPTGTPVATFKVYGSDDPRVKADIQKGIYGKSTGATAKWVQLTLPAGSVHIDPACSSVTVVLPDDEIAWSGADEAEFVINLENPNFYVCLRYDHGGAADGAATGLYCWAGARC